MPQLLLKNIDVSYCTAIPSLINNISNYPAELTLKVDNDFHLQPPTVAMVYNKLIEDQEQMSLHIIRNSTELHWLARVKHR